MFSLNYTFLQLYFDCLYRTNITVSKKNRIGHFRDRRDGFKIFKNCFVFLIPHRYLCHNPGCNPSLSPLRHHPHPGIILPLLPKYFKHLSPLSSQCHHLGEAGTPHSQPGQLQKQLAWCPDTSQCPTLAKRIFPH